jgi:hypothetical protein
VLLLVATLLDASLGTIRADATGVSVTDLVAPTRLVLDGSGLQALHALVESSQGLADSGSNGK